MVKTEKLPTQWPKPWENVLLKTKNAMGVMMAELSPPAEEFVKLAKKAQKPLMDVGATYGIATLPALAAGAKVIACDLEQQHLDILRQSTPLADRDRLTTLKAAFPDQIQLADNSLAGILISNVLHFLDGPTLERGMQKCYQWLMPGGKLFVVTGTINLSFYKLLKPMLEKNLANGKPWPGYFDISQAKPDEWQDLLPDHIHLLDQGMLTKLATAAGFTIEQCYYFCYDSLPEQHRTNGEEFLAMIAIK